MRETRALRIHARTNERAKWHPKSPALFSRYTFFSPPLKNQFFKRRIRLIWRWTRVRAPRLAPTRRNLSLADALRLKIRESFALIIFASKTAACNRVAAARHDSPKFRVAPAPRLPVDAKRPGACGTSAVESVNGGCLFTIGKRTKHRVETEALFENTGSWRGAEEPLMAR